MTSCPFTLMETFIMLKIYIGTVFLYEAVTGYETCFIGGDIRYCENGCCSVGDATFCCLTTYMIIGIVFGCIAAVCSIASIVFCILHQKKRSGQVLAHPTRVMVVSMTDPHIDGVSTPGHGESHSKSLSSREDAEKHFAQNHTTPQPPSYTSVKPLPPGYSSHYYPTYPTGLPPYANNSQPPPPYSFNSPSSNQVFASEVNSGRTKQ